MAHAFHLCVWQDGICHAASTKQKKQTKKLKIKDFNKAIKKTKSLYNENLIPQMNGKH